MNWGIPEREFRHFVLPVRVNNEDLDRFRAVYADEICKRVKGMSLHDAVLEINHWCHEWVTYVGTDARTRGPLALMKSGEGRCGEESTFTVSALRAAGIPARQVYTPLWAHTDSNHAWVEAWVDGEWCFLGACEPDPELNMGWFNAAVSRALLLHTKVSGNYQGPEDIIARNPVYTEINVIRDYVPTRLTTVIVVDESGKPVPGVDVEYKLFNYGDFGNVCTVTTDNEGKALLNTGCGTPFPTTLRRSRSMPTRNVLHTKTTSASQGMRPTTSSSLKTVSSPTYRRTCPRRSMQRRSFSRS